jgi:hypothetical protein
MAVELATGFVSLTVSARGIQNDIAKEFKGADKIAGDAGKQAGGEFGQKFSDGATSGDKVAASSRELGTKLAKGLAVAGAAVAAFSIHAAHSFTEATSAVKAFQRVAGGTFEDASRLVFLFKRLGIEPELATKAIGLLSRNLATGKVDLEKYGVTVKRNADGSVNMKDAIVDLAGALHGLNANQRAAAVFEIFGRSGQQLLPILAKTKGELSEIFALAAKDHQVFGKKDIEQADSYKKSLAELNAAWGGLQAQLGKAVIPILKGVTDTLTPLTQLIADNAGALTKLGAIAGGPALAAIGAIFITQKALDFAPATKKILEFAKGLRTAGTAAEGLKGSLAGLALGTIIVAGFLALGKAIGYFDDQQTKVQKNAPRWAQAVVASSLAAGHSVADAREKFAALGKQIDATQKLQTAVVHSTSQGAQAWSKYGKTLQDVFERGRALTTHLGDLNARHAALGRTIDLLSGSQEKQVKTTAASREIASALSQTILDTAAKSGTYAAAQERLAQATARASAASRDDKGAKKELQDAINGVANAQERMNNAVLASVDASLAAQSAELTLTQAIKDHADGLTLAQDASALAKAKVEQWNQALILAGKPPLDAKTATDIYRQSLVDTAKQFPETAAALIPLIAQIDDAKRAASEAQGDYPVKVPVQITGIPELDALNSRIAALHDKDIRITVNGQKFLVPFLLARPGLASGGPVIQGQSYVVGEKGPELFTPNTNGRILSHADSMARLMPAGGDGNPIVVNLVVDGQVLARTVQKVNGRNGRNADRVSTGR